MARQSISKRLRLSLFERDEFTCQYCGAFAPNVMLVLDHIHPVALGGTSTHDNLVTACIECNQGKSARTMDVLPNSGRWTELPGSDIDPLDYENLHPVAWSPMPMPFYLPRFNTDYRDDTLLALYDAEEIAFRRELRRGELEACAEDGELGPEDWEEFVIVWGEPNASGA